jgi:hypothetical protein
MRALLKNGEYRWYLNQYNPLKDEHGRVLRWYVTGTDIDDQKKTEERLRNENLALREEIDRTSMFEEIVGSSKPMRQVLKQVEKVAPSDSTVLILGETGTGKELIARALHRRSKRAARAFVRVNCAAIPQSLIASELFGHEEVPSRAHSNGVWGDLRPPTAARSFWTKSANPHGNADLAAARIAGARIRASGKQPSRQSRRPPYRGNQSEPAASRRSRNLPAGSLL